MSAATPSSIFSSRSIAVLVGTIGLLTIGLSLKNRRVTENARLAELVKHQMQQGQIYDDQLREQQHISEQLRKKLAADHRYPDTVTAYGVDIKKPTILSYSNHSSLGATAKEFDIYFRLKNHLFNEEDHTVEFTVVLKKPHSLETNNYARMISKDLDSCMVSRQWLAPAGSSLDSGDYAYQLYVRGKLAGSGNFTKH